MDLDRFSSWCEEQIYNDLEEVYKKANLTELEKSIFNKYKKYNIENWLLRAKNGYFKSGAFIEQNDEFPNFIQLLARALINLDSPKVSGAKVKFIKEMFGDKTIHKCQEIEKGHFRSEIISNIIENKYFELRLMSFFIENMFEIELCSSKIKGKKIPEFVAIKNNLRINVEAKKMDEDKIADNIFGNHFIEGIDYNPTAIELEKGYGKIKAALENNYEKALLKFYDIPSTEFFVIFISVYFKLEFMGQQTIDYLNSIPDKWNTSRYNNLAGVVLLDQYKTYFLENKNCKLRLSKDIKNITFLHEYEP